MGPAAGAAAEPLVRAGYVRVEPYQPSAVPVLDMFGVQFVPGAPPTRFEANRPRVAVLVPPGEKGQPPGRYEVLHLEPGRYFVFANLQGGPSDWAWVTVEAGGKVTADLALDAGKTGALSLTVPPGAEFVSVVPAAEPGKPWPETLVLTAASMLDLHQKLPKADKDTTVLFPRLKPGRYEVYAGELTATAEVKAGETAKAELKKGK